jgi:hypothetical protein
MMMLHHPGSMWSTASLLSQPITLHPANSPRAGHPTTKNGRDSFGQTVTGHRTPDGSVWFEPGGYPDLLVEFEGDRSRLRIVEHIEAALWQSSVMRRPTTLVVGTTTRSDSGVRRAINSYISSREPWMHRADWPFANVLVRVARASALRSVCPLHGDVDEQWLLRV